MDTLDTGLFPKGLYFYFIGVAHRQIQAHFKIREIYWFPHSFNNYLLASTLGQAVNRGKEIEPP